MILGIILSSLRIARLTPFDLSARTGSLDTVFTLSIEHCLDGVNARVNANADGSRGTVALPAATTLAGSI